MLEAQALPNAGDWERATELANTVFGIEASRLMNAQNVAGLAQALRGAAGEPHRGAAGALADSLRTRLDARGIRAADADRFRTASATLSLLSALCTAAEDDALVATLAGASVQTGAVAMGQSLTSARSVAAALAPDQWEVFERIDTLAEPVPGACPGDRNERG